MPPAVHPVRPARLLALLIVLGLGCEPSSAKIQSWKGDQPEGTEKLAAVVADPGVDPRLRGEAAAALVETGHSQEMEAAIAGLDIDARAAMVPRAVQGMTPLVAGGGERAAEARAALYALREQIAAADARVRIDAVLFPALVADVRAGRARAGRLAVKDMLVGIGPPIVQSLLPLLEDPAVPFPTIVEVIDKVGDVDAKNKAGAALVTRAGKLPALPEDLPPALNTLGGQAPADFLMKVVDGTNPIDAERAATALAKLYRAQGVASFAARKAGTPTTAPALREKLFVVTEESHSDESKQALLAMIRGSLEPATRYRAFRALLKSAGGGGILEGLEAFPAAATYTHDDVHQQIVAPLSAMPGFDTRPPLFKAFESRAPLARLVAVLVIGNMGFESDAANLDKLAKDQGAVKGLPPDDRVGRQATRMAATLRAKKS
jgi:hypothetical protein